MWLDQGDIGGQFAWLEDQLATLRTNGQRAYYLQHHPMLSVYGNVSNYLVNLLIEYDDVIVACFYGHSHDDQFFVYSGGSLQSPTPSLVGYIAGAGTPNGQNPSFRIYDVDAVTGDLLDFYHYRPNLAAQGLIHNTSPTAPKPIWNLVYQASELYNLTSLDAQSWYDLAVGMKTNDQTFESYFINYPGGLSNGIYTPSQRQGLVCEIIGGDADGYTYCMNNY